MAKTFAALLAQITDATAPLPAGDLHLLSDLDEQSAATFRTTWPSLDLPRRRELMRHLADICQHNFEVDFAPIALLGATDPDSLVRLAAIETFWDSEDPRLISVLVQLMQRDPEVTVQASAAQALGQFVLVGELGRIPAARLEQLVATLLATIQDGEKATLVRCRALEALAAAEHQLVPALINEAYRSEEEVMRISAICAMGRTADPAWQPYILEELDNVNPSMRYHAAQAAGHLELPEALAQLIKLLDDPNPEVVMASIRSLGDIGDPQARTALEALLQYEDVAELVEDALEQIDLAGDLPSYFQRN